MISFFEQKQGMCSVIISQKKSVQKGLDNLTKFFLEPTFSSFNAIPKNKSPKKNDMVCAPGWNLFDIFFINATLQEHFVNRAAQN